MVKVPVRFKRVAEAFDEVARVKLCESSGSEHSADQSLTDLSDLVNSFLEREIYKEDVEGIEKGDHHHQHHEQEKDADDEIEGENNKCSRYEKKDVLKSLLGINGDADVRRKIHGDVEKACLELVGDFSSSASKRQLMARLRDRGLDAGLCKSKWEKDGRCPSGVYEYIDVTFNGTRYIVEVSLAGEFEIARPTGCYASLLEVFPPIFVGKAEEMKKIVKLMCSAMRTSMKAVDIHVPPWRRAAYMQAKWFASYKRTINDVAAAAGKALNRNINHQAFSTKRTSIGFVPAVPVVSYYCREDFVSKTGRKVGNLAAAINGSPMLL